MSSLSETSGWAKALASVREHELFPPRCGMKHCVLRVGLLEGNPLVVVSDRTSFNSKSPSCGKIVHNDSTFHV